MYIELALMAFEIILANGAAYEWPTYLAPVFGQPDTLQKRFGLREFAHYLRFSGGQTGVKDFCRIGVPR